MESIKALWIIPSGPKDGIHDYAMDLLGQTHGLALSVHTATPPSNSTRLRELLQTCKAFDIIHVQYDPFHWTKGRRNTFEHFSQNCRKPLVVTVHEIYDQSPFYFPLSKVTSCLPGLVILKRLLYYYKHPNYLSERRLCAASYNADVVVVHNESQKAVLARKGVCDERVRVIPIGVPVNNRPDTPVKTEEIVLGTFGFINPSVDYELAMEALSGLKSSWKYRIGGGPRTEEGKKLLGKIEEYAAHLDLSKKIDITGHIEEALIPDFMRSLNIYVAPFSYKSSSASLNRAISMGLPIIAPEIPVIRDIKARKNCVELYAPGDALSLRNAISRLIGHPVTARALSSNALEYARTFTFENEARETYKLYKELVR